MLSKKGAHPLLYPPYQRRQKTIPKQIITSQSAPTTGFTDKGAPSPLAQAIRAGNLLFVSGQGPLDPKTREVVGSDIREQTKQTLTNLRCVLASRRCRCA